MDEMNDFLYATAVAGAEQVLADSIHIGDRLRYPARPWDIEKHPERGDYMDVRVIAKYPHLVVVKPIDKDVVVNQVRTISYQEMIADRRIMKGAKKNERF